MYIRTSGEVEDRTLDPLEELAWPIVQPAVQQRERERNTTLNSYTVNSWETM